jgi:hypothetical protein
MAITMFRTCVSSYMLKRGYGGSDDYITAVEAERVTASSVFIDGKRSAIESEIAQYHSTWDAAHKYVTERAVLRQQYAAERLAKANADVAAIAALTPTVAPGA